MEGPSKFLFGLEGIRAVYEYGISWMTSSYLEKISPHGDGHPVIVFPGLGTTDQATSFIRGFLDDIGYHSYPWARGRNLGPQAGLSILLDDLLEYSEEIYQKEQQPISLIGWSLGGIYSRELAKLNPHIFRQVITLGTPFKFKLNGTNVSKLYDLLSKDKSHRDPRLIKKIGEPPPVPFSSLYSKSDGVVSWECSIEDNLPFCENIEVIGSSHLGLSHNPMSLIVIADRLTKTRENWSPYNEKSTT